MTIGSKNLTPADLDIIEDSKSASGYSLTTHGGTKVTGVDAFAWIASNQHRGIGELLINSVDADGTKSGFNIELIKAVDSDTIPINYSETTMDYCFDIILENEDYTIGKVLEYLLYEKYYVTDKVFSFCGFKKFHPHNTDSVIRVAYVSANDKNMVKQHLRLVCIDASEIFKRIYELF
jgi:DNA-directed RNA polymerase subunit L